ncbi:NADH:ubiquinone oxidoreductase [Humibacillus sp. DSM 29435]|uniref:NADH-quinone oxidoreductase subunit B family protein n=1 Tax=Humibacillus sp. DSM 29435 TaxID=1869167 RepID=UPI000872BDAE|nr:ferredoxin [Humibacillus sp. DSM 29435]OFE17834.1 NADH:ubiquinone oxidoreductase [Humibacillus sp. DSM 29435]
MPWVTRGLRNGVVTSRWPRHADDYFDTFPAAVDVNPDPSVLSLESVEEIDGLCPTGAITIADPPPDGTTNGGTNGGASCGQRLPQVRLDRGRCILCGRCVAQRPDLFSWAPGSDTARLERDQLVVGSVPDTEDNLRAVQAELARRVRSLRRSVHIRHVDAGSDGSDEWEIQALMNPVYDVHRLGIFFTASPRHADILLVTGIGSVGMLAPLQRTRQAMPDPVVVIAAGVEAISGGLLRTSYIGRAGIGEVLDVDIWVPGSPASPFSLLHAILLALGRLPAVHPQDTRAGGKADEGSG